MTNLVNGFASESVAVNDRGLLYGQSVFETLAVADGEPLLLTQHIDRLQRGCAALSIPLSESNLRQEIDAVADGLDRAVVRITVTMGQGGRGYKNPSLPETTRIVTSHPYPDYDRRLYTDGIVLGVSDVRLSEQPLLAGIKHGNRLEQVLARAQWQADWHEALMLNQADQVIEATQSNLFIRRAEGLSTPPVDRCGVAGVMREFVLANAAKLGLKIAVEPLALSDVSSADEVFVTNSLIGAWPVRKFQQQHYNNFATTTQLLTIMQRDGAI